MRFLGLLFIFLLFNSCALVGIHFKVHNPNKAGKVIKYSDETILLGELTEQRTCYDVHYYDFSLTVDSDKKKLDGIVQIHATAKTDFSTLQIDLHPNFEITKLMDKTTQTALNYTWNERAVFVEADHKKGDNFILEIAYNGKPEEAKKAPWKGGFVWKKDEAKYPWLGVACETDGASLWWPLKDHTSDEADSVRMHYTVPKELVAVGNGQLESATENGDYKTYNWFVSYPINSYNVTIYVGKFRHFNETYKGINDKILQLDYYVLEPHYLMAKRHFEQVVPILKAYEELFGEYPWYRDGFKLVESPYAGMEHQSAIAYGQGYKNGYGSSTDYIILHETAHEWWGNSITVKDLADVWIQEGFATYSEALYAEKEMGKEGYESTMLNQRIMIKNKYPVIGVKDRRCFHFRKNSDVYGKGSWILHSLRCQMEDDSLFFDILKSFYGTYKYQIVESKDFTDMVNAKTGEDYGWFFDQYLSSNFVPELDYTYTDKGVVYYRWSNVPANFNKLKIKIIANNKPYTLTPSVKTQHFDLPQNSRGEWQFEFEDMAVLFALNENKGILKGK
jgi:aminopeptidase N